MARPKKGDPELLLVSFCDIVTVTCVAMFMAMVIVIDQAMRTPRLRPTPMAHATTNAPLFFECRAGQVFPIERPAFENMLQKAQEEFKASHPDGASVEAALQELNTLDVGDAFYRIRNSYLLMGILAIDPRPEAKGITHNQLAEPSNRFQTTLARASKPSEYVVFLVRDDSFSVFRSARDFAHAAGFQIGWEYLGRGEPIVFDTAGRVQIQ
jgi:hypothetical protein